MLTEQEMSELGFCTPVNGQTSDVITVRRDELTDTAADAAIEQACRILRLPTG